MINEHCRIHKVICIYKFSAILKILKSISYPEPSQPRTQDQKDPGYEVGAIVEIVLKSARRSEAPLAVTSHLGPSLVIHLRFFSRLLQNDWD